MGKIGGGREPQEPRAFGSDAEHRNQGGLWKEASLGWVLKNKEVPMRLREWTIWAGVVRDKAERCPTAGDWILAQDTTEHLLVADTWWDRPPVWLIWTLTLLQWSAQKEYASVTSSLAFLSLASSVKFSSITSIKLEEVIKKKRSEKGNFKKSPQLYFFSLADTLRSLISTKKAGLWALSVVRLNPCCVLVLFAQGVGKKDAQVGAGSLGPSRKWDACLPRALKRAKS